MLIGLWLGIFLLLICLAVLIFGTYGVTEFLGVFFVVIIAAVLIVQYLKKKKEDLNTKRNGEECYAKIIKCIETGAFVLSKKEYKVIVTLYVPSLTKRIILEEIVGYNNAEKYPNDSYFSVLYYNNDINIKEMVSEKDIPGDILKILNDEEVQKEYQQYLSEQEQKRNEMNEKVEGKVKKIVPVIERALFIRNIVLCYVITIFIIIITSYLSRMMKLMSDFMNNMPMAIIYPLALVISLSLPIPLIKSQESSPKRLIFGLLWFFSLAFIMMSAVN